MGLIVVSLKIHKDTKIKPKPSEVSKNRAYTALTRFLLPQKLLGLSEIRDEKGAKALPSF